MAAIDSSDIQFLGNWNSQQQPPSSSFVSAIVLMPVNPETSPLDVTRTFSRNQTSVVHVGRTPAADPAAPAEDRATFVNPVMSRNHAKITFADSGSVFIIDTGSHHGTWVARSPGQFKLAPESPFLLQDGDKLTFGKEVQRNGILHKPLTVSVKLLHSVSTPSSMSISSGSLSPLNRVASPKPRNRFGLDQSSDSDASSDSEDSHDTDPCTGPNAIRVELPIHRPEGCIQDLGSPKTPKAAALVESDSSSPDTTNNPLATPQHSPGTRYPMSPLYYSPEVSSPPGPELEGMDMLADAAHEATSSSNAIQSPPPWRRLTVSSPWSSLNTSIFERMPDLLQQPPRKIGRLLNPLWIRASRGSISEERGGRSNILSRPQNGTEVADIPRGGHGHGPDHEHCGSGLEHGHHGHHHGPCPKTDRLDAEWGVYGHRSGAVRDEIKTLGQQLEQLQMNVEKLKTMGEEGSMVHAVFSSRLDELSIQLKDKASHQTSFTELTGLNALKDTIVTLQNDISTLKSHKSAMQTDIRFLRANQEDLKMEFAGVKDDVETRANEGSEFMDDVRSLRKDVRECSDDIDMLETETREAKSNVFRIVDEIATLQGDVRMLLEGRQGLDEVTAKMSGQIQEVTIAQQALRARIREEARAEVKALIEEGGELYPIIGKRKRGDAEVTDASAPVASAPRPRKRLRIVADCAAAGAIGALGAWLGLAFL